ncbi:MAG: transcription antitermination factor NusB, partial [Candidatus Paceibacterota bacterium]
MANRHLSRSIVLQSLYEWDFGNKSPEEGVVILDRNVEEFAPGMGDYTFIKALFSGVIEKQKDLDTIIEKAAPDWPIDKIATVDRNILRLGLYELLFGDRSEVPPKVAINEAIELAKSFGGDTSSKFVNGVLGAVYKEMGEPGKEETSKRKNIDPNAKLPEKTLCGAVVYARDNDKLYLALVHDIFGHWTLSKGRIQEGEEKEDGVKREVKEEIGL